MRKVPLPPREDRVWKRWIRDCERATAELNAARKQGRAPDINGKVYGRKSIRDSHFFAQDGPFLGRCAYCESPIKAGQHGDVEHFRPKRAVDGEPSHPGYYWLAYDKTNLLPSCQACNQMHKKTRFPVRGFRAFKPGDEAREEPLLINPLDPNDEPADHLGCDLESGLMTAMSDRGQTCIDLLALNARDDLVEARADAVARVERLIFKARTLKMSSATSKLRDIKAEKLSYSLFRAACLKSRWPSFPG